jgi:hypothetical protein
MSSSPAGGSRTRVLGLLFGVVALLSAFALASLASGAADPLSGGSVKLSLKAKGLKFSPKGPSLTITGGSVDPTNMSGSSTVTGKTTVKKGAKKTKLQFTAVTFTGGGAGSIDGKIGSKKVAKCLTFSGGALGRNGFDGTLSNAKTKLGKKCAKALGKKLGKVKTGSWGKVTSADTTPSAVTLTGGTATLTFDPAALDKLNRKGVDLQVQAPATETKTGTGGSLTAAEYKLPITGGSLAPNGSSGQLNTGGAIVLKKTANSESSSTGLCGITNNEVDVQNAVFDLAAKSVTATAVITTPPNPAGNSTINGGQLAVVQNVQFTANPNTKAFNGTAGLVNSVAAAGVENAVFGSSSTPGSSGGPCNTAAGDFAANDVIGPAALFATGQ